MSYASVAAQNAPPPSEQPKPDRSLLNTSPPTHPNLADDTAKVNIVAPEFKADPHTYTSEADRIAEANYESIPITSPAINTIPAPVAKKSKDQNDNSNGEAVKSNYLWQLTKKYLMRPGVAGGLVGLVNIGILASVGRTFYLRPHLRRDVSAISSTIAATIALIAAEGFVAERYLQTPGGQVDARKARKEGFAIFEKIHEHVLRPQVLGGLIGIFNTAVLGAVGYLSYMNWDRPWDKRTVSAISVGLLTLWGGEGIMAERSSK